jgi:dihydroorotate dehydrogenase (NAD+) catalytic subunit
MEQDMVQMKIKFCGIEFKNPVTTAAGTFVAKESEKYYDISALGSVTTKGVSIEPWNGNPTPRIAETYGGMLNSVGLENPGVDAYVAGELKYLKEKGVVVIANVAGHSEEEYLAVVEKLADTNVDILEINVSCPNVKEGGITFGTDPKEVAKLTGLIRKKAGKKPVVVKLTPNVTDVCEIAKAAESAGADGLSLINTLLGMKIDARTARPILANVTGGLSGPAVKPVALQMVYRVSRAVKIPIIGMGGIMTGEDALEFILAGASLSAVGTAALIDPAAPQRIATELAEATQKYYPDDTEIGHLVGRSHRAALLTLLDPAIYGL